MRIFIILLFLSCTSPKTINISANQLAGEYHLSWHFYNGLYKVYPSGLLAISEDSTYSFTTCGTSEYGRWLIEDDSVAFYSRPDTNSAELQLSFRAKLNTKYELVHEGGKVLRGSWLIKNRKPLNVFYKVK